MRNLMLIGICLAAASMAGWFKIQRDGERTMIEIDRTEIRDDTRRAIDRGKEFLDNRDPAYGVDPQSAGQYAETQYAETQYADTQYADTQYSGNQYYNQPPAYAPARPQPIYPPQQSQYVEQPGNYVPPPQYPRR